MVYRIMAPDPLDQAARNLPLTGPRTRNHILPRYQLPTSGSVARLALVGAA